MPTVKATTTSPDSVAFDPIVLRSGTLTQLVFKPLMVKNAQDQWKPVKGDLLWQKKLKAGSWQDETHLSLQTMTAGSGVKLSLTTDELHDLTQAVRGLYGFYWDQKRLPTSGEEIDLGASAQKAGTAVGNAFDLLNQLSSRMNETTLPEIVRWLTETPHAAESLKLVAQMDEDKLAKLNSLAGVAALRKLHETWSANIANSKEQYWQDLFAEHSFALAQLFTVPVVVIGEKTYMGGKSIEDKGGKYGDFLTKNFVTGHVSLIEIKTPTTKLLGGEYRTGVYGPSNEVAGAVTQVAVCKDELTKNYYALAMKSEEKIRVADPHCIIITGHTSELDQDKKRDSFELFRRNLRGVEIITFDELFRRVEMLADMLEGVAEQSTDDSAVDTAENESNCS